MFKTKFNLWLERKDGQTLPAGEITLESAEYGTLTEQDALQHLTQSGDLWADPETERTHLFGVSTPTAAYKAARAEVVSQWVEEPE